jgi:hypothetical protein
MARPTILTRELCDQITKALEDGNYFETACNAYGVSKQDGYNWLNKGQEGAEAPGDWPDAYRVFFDACEKASALAEVAAVGEVRAAAQPYEYEVTEKGSAYAVVRTEDGETRLPGQWQAAMTFLERRFGNRWKRTEAVGLHGVAGEAPVAVAWWQGIEAAQEQAQPDGQEAATDDSGAEG